jgi:hypothetical protein
MAQTKRKTKHRGNAAGIIESRGRTGRKPTEAEKSLKGREAATAREKRAAKRDRPPSWRGSIYRSAGAALIMLVLATVLTKSLAASLVLFPIVFLVYVPLSYYSDLWFYRRRMRGKDRGSGKAPVK